MIINTITSIKFEVNIILILLIQMIIKMLCDFLLYFQNYISIVHDECLKNKINIDVMHIGTSVGIQYFDDPEFYPVLLSIIAKEELCSIAFNIDDLVKWFENGAEPFDHSNLILNKIKKKLYKDFIEN